MSKAPVSRTKLNNAVALFATFLVVGGIAAVAYMAAPREGRLPLSVHSTSSTPIPSSRSTLSLLVMNPDGARIVTERGSAPIRLPEEASKLGRSFWTIHGVDVESGDSVYLSSDDGRATTTRIFSPDGQRSVEPAPPKSDATATLRVRTQADQRVFPLRLKNGVGVHDAMTLGWWDTDAVAFTAVAAATTTRAVYRLDARTGEVRHIAQLPDYYERVRLLDGAVWYVKATPGEGIEQAAIPPSEFHRINAEGKDDLLVREDDAVIGNYAVGQDGFAYQLGEDAVRWKNLEQGMKLSLKETVPLFFLRRGSMLAWRDQEFLLYETPTSEPKPLAAASSSTMVFLLEDLNP